MHKSGKTIPPIPLASSTRPPMGDGTAPAPKEEKILTVRYSLPQLLAEIRLERANSQLAMEKLHQAEITKLFSSKPKVRRGKAKS